MTSTNPKRLGAICSLLILLSASFVFAVDYNGTLNSSQQGLEGGVGFNGTVQYPDGVACTDASQCSGANCVHSICRSATTFCGDTFCDTGESTSNCAVDCPAGGGATPTPTPTATPTAPPTLGGGGSGGGGGGGGGSTVTPTPTATATPTPTLAPGEISVAETTTEFQQLLPTGSGTSAPIMVTRSLQVSEEPSVAGGFVSTFTLTVENGGGQTLEMIEVREKIPSEVIPEYLGPSPDDYPGIEWSPRPVRIEKGSVIAVWLIQKLAGNEQLQFVYSIAKKMTMSVTQTAEYKTSPVIVSQAGTATAAPTVTITATPKPTAKPGFAIDGNLLIGAAVVIVLIGAYFLLFKRRKRHKGL